tara:strand:+ start:385 stop:588 length:204 start_codon:yes stop_codon:yes gene_type:complete
MAKKKENKWKSYGVPLAEPITGNVDSAFFDIDLNPARKEGETKEEYRARRKEGNRRIKLHQKGRKVN